MGRPVVLSNGQLFVGLDESGLVHDFYYPYVGLDNLTNARSLQHKIGVWVDGKFSWVDDGSWKISVDFNTDALISEINMHSDSLNVHLAFEDFVDTDYTALIRRIRVNNLSDQEREIRLFMHQVFQISRAGRADTALYVPDENYLLDYKGRCSLLIAGKFVDGEEFDQYAVGAYEVEGKDGTYVDAEDGELSNNPVEHGGVDSVLRFARKLPGGSSYGVDYWIVASDNQFDAQNTHLKLKKYDISERLIKARDFWKAWLKPAVDKLAVLEEDYRKAALKSLLIIKAHCDSRGSVLASGDSSIFNYGRDYYCYCWPRDSAFSIWPLIRLGIYEEARNFFEFARDTMNQSGYLMHKYQPDRSIGSTWHPLVHNNVHELAIQEDETASVLFMMGEYYKASHDKEFLESFYDTFIAKCANFMVGFIDTVTGLSHASYDLWEEKFLTTTYSVCTVIAALDTAANLAKESEHPDDEIAWGKAADKLRDNLSKLYNDKGYFIKGLLLKPDQTIEYDETIDISSMYGPFMFSGLPLDNPMITKAAETTIAKLANAVPIGGVVRYDNDGYFRSDPKSIGNPWIVATLWIAEYLIAKQDKATAKQYLDWVIARQQPSGVLSEQFDPKNGRPLSVAPLVWSHSELVSAVMDYYNL